MYAATSKKKVYKQPIKTHNALKKDWHSGPAVLALTTKFSSWDSWRIPSPRWQSQSQSLGRKGSPTGQRTCKLCRELRDMVSITQAVVGLLTDAEAFESSMSLYNPSPYYCKSPVNLFKARLG